MGDKMRDSNLYQSVYVLSSPSLIPINWNWQWEWPGNEADPGN